MGGKRVAKSATKLWPRKWAGPLLAVIALLLVGAVMAGCAYAERYTDIFPGVSAAGIELGGLSEAEAGKKLQQELPALLQGTTVEILLGSETLTTLDLQQLHVSADAAAVAAEAMRAGRGEGWLMTGLRLLQAYLGAEEAIPVELSGNEEGLRALIAQLAEGVDVTPESAGWALEPAGLFATKQRDGRRVDQEALYQRLAAPVSLGSSVQVECPVEEIPAQGLDLQALAAELSGQVSNAWYDAQSGQVREGRIGVTMDPEAAAYVLEAAADGARVQLPAEVIYPTLTAAELEKVLFRDLLGTATTTVTGSSARRGNVKLAGESCNGTVLNDGDLFDYNLVVGERTAERGFGAAATYINGMTVDTIGGGICQVSSTVYKAALLSNLEIVERYAHRFYPGYIDLGMDATVSWGGPEFRFKNNTGYPMRMEVIYENSKLTVNIYGTKTDDTYVKMTREVLSSTGFTTEYVESPDLAPGQQKEKQNGYTGYEVISYRNIYDGSGNLISTTEEARSSYKSRNQIILVGPDAPQEETPPPAGGDSGSDEPTLPPTDPGSTETGGGAQVPGEPGLPEDDVKPGWL